MSFLFFLNFSVFECKIFKQLNHYMMNVNDLTQKKFFFQLCRCGGWCILKIFAKKIFLQVGGWSNLKIVKILPITKKKIIKQPVITT